MVALWRGWLALAHRYKSRVQNSAGWGIKTALGNDGTKKKKKKTMEMTGSESSDAMSDAEVLCRI